MKGRLAALVGTGVLGLTSTALANMKVPDEGWNVLWHKVLVDLAIIGVVFGIAAIVMLFKYKAKNPNDVGHGPKLSKMQAIGWALVPAFLFMADDFFMAAKGWTLWNTYRNVPENAMEIKVTGSMWAWEFEYPNGVVTSYDPDSKEGEGLVIPAGTPIVMRMSSNDVIHSFSLARYRVKEDVMPGRVTYLWFYPDKVENSHVTCAEFCGTRHSYMYAPVKAVEQADFDAWLKKMAEGA